MRLKFHEPFYALFDVVDALPMCDEERGSQPLKLRHTFVSEHICHKLHLLYIASGGLGESF